MACYYHDRNEELKDSFAKLAKDEHFMAFAKEKARVYEEKNESPLDLTDFEVYK